MAKNDVIYGLNGLAIQYFGTGRNPRGSIDTSFPDMNLVVDSGEDNQSFILDERDVQTLGELRKTIDLSGRRLRGSARAGFIEIFYNGNGPNPTVTIDGQNIILDSGRGKVGQFVFNYIRSSDPKDIPFDEGYMYRHFSVFDSIQDPRKQFKARRTDEVTAGGPIEGTPVAYMYLTDRRDDQFRVNFHDRFTFTEIQPQFSILSGTVPASGAYQLHNDFNTLGKLARAITHVTGDEWIATAEDFDIEPNTSLRFSSKDVSSRGLVPVRKKPVIHRQDLVASNRNITRLHSFPVWTAEQVGETFQNGKEADALNDVTNHPLELRSVFDYETTQDFHDSHIDGIQLWDDGWITATTITDSKIQTITVTVEKEFFHRPYMYPAAPTDSDDVRDLMEPWIAQLFGILKPKPVVKFPKEFALGEIRDEYFSEIHTLTVHGVNYHDSALVNIDWSQPSRISRGENFARLTLTFERNIQRNEFEGFRNVP